MKAVVYKRRSLPDKLVYCDVEKPVPGDNEALVKVVSVSVNAADYRSMKYGIIPKKKIFGSDIAGIVVSAGKKISMFKPGDEVTGEIADYGFGGFAEYALAPERLLVHKPPELSFEEAAALPMAALTALQSLRDKGNVKSGDDVLILGSAGGVGTFAVQLAKYFGATVTAVCSTGNIEQTKALGADYIVDYTKEDFIKSRYDIILAVNGNYPLTACKKMLKPEGRYVMIGGALSQIFKAILFGWLFSLRKGKVTFLTAKANQEDLKLIMMLAEKGTIKPVIDRRYSLDKGPDAMRYLSEGHARGKVVINVE